MKKFINFLIIFTAGIYSVFAAEQLPQLTSDEDLDYAELVTSIDKVEPPYLKDDYVIFTADSTSRHIGIAFDFENFKTIHSFKKKKFMDIEYNESGSLYFYILKLPKTILSVNYRLIIDGLWTTDPLNDNKIYSHETSMYLSHFDAERYIPPVTEKTASSNSVHFVYRGKSGQNIRLGGSFTNWDSWIYQMKETAPGLYSFDLPLPPGKYEYAFYTGITSFPDSGNPQRCYTEDGKIASLLIVD